MVRKQWTIWSSYAPMNSSKFYLNKKIDRWIWIVLTRKLSEQLCNSLKCRLKREKEKSKNKEKKRKERKNERKELGREEMLQQ